MRITVRADVRGTKRWMLRLHRRQVPFATSQALNDTAFHGRTHIVRKTYPKAFDVKNARFAGVAFRVRKATKQRLVATVYDRLGRDYLERHAEGGVKRPRGRHVAVPTPIVGRTTGGAVRKPQRPRAVLNRKTVYKTRLRTGSEGVFRRLPRSGGKGELLYVLATQARIRKRFAFYEDMERVARQRFRRAFQVRFAKAVATAR